MSRREAILVLGAGYSQEPLYRHLSDSVEAVLVAVDRCPDAPAFPLAAERLVCSTHDPESILDEIKDARWDYKWIGVVNRSHGKPTVTAARISEALGLPGPPVDAARIAMDKSETIRHMRGAGVAVPDQIAVEQLECGAVEYPVVVKPRETVVGKHAIWVLRSATDWRRYKREFDATVPVARCEVESYVEGDDLLIMCSMQNGVLHPFAQLQEYVGIQNNCPIRGLGFGTKPASELPSSLAVMLNKVAASLKLRNGVMNVAIRAGSGAFTFIEIHLDIGGDLVLDALLPAAGLSDALVAYCRPFLGMPVSSRLGDIRRHAVMYYLFPEDLKRVECSDIEQLPNVARVDPKARGRAHGYAVIRAESHADLIDSVRQLDRLLNRQADLALAPLIHA